MALINFHKFISYNTGVLYIAKKGPELTTKESLCGSHIPISLLCD